jgi:hypothetical protein
MQGNLIDIAPAAIIDIALAAIKFKYHCHVI